MTNQKMRPLVCEQALHLEESREFTRERHAGAARGSGTRERHAEGDGKEMSFNCNMFMCVICQKCYSNNPVKVYLGVGIPQRKVRMAQG